MITLTEEQQFCLNQILDWWVSYRRKQPFFRLGGYAGTGKTCLINDIVNKVIKTSNKNLKISVCALTGKAVERLRTVINISLNVELSTIHRLMYTPVIDVITGEIKSWVRNHTLTSDLIIIDEASMVSPELWEDLTSYNIPILLVGDPFQLPPVVSDGTKFSLLSTADAMLVTVHRQAAQSPIIKLSMRVRESIVLPQELNSTNLGAKLVLTKDKNILEERLKLAELDDTVVLVGTNKQRFNLNSALRKYYKMTDNPISKGEKMICLKNNYNRGVFNGSILYADSLHGSLTGSYKFLTKVKFSNGTWAYLDFRQLNYQGLYPNQLRDKLMGDMELKMDYGYALTVHKSQGSQWKNVIVFNPYYLKSDPEEYNRWLYTAITRSTEYLTIIF